MEQVLRAWGVHLPGIQQLFAALAVGLTFYAFGPYVWHIIKGRIRPHVFSWVIWALTTLVVGIAQGQAGGGWGAWVIGISGGITLGIAVLAWWRRGDCRITRLDWAFFIGALAALPCWYLTADPFWAVAVLTTVDVLGFGPTIRAAYVQPHGESAGFFGLFLVRNLLVILALAHWSATTVLFPAAVAVACAGLILVILVRRRQIVAC